jgi:hypothetical protein
MSSNYPIVRLTDGRGGVFYARTFGWSVGVATGDTAVSTNFTLPSGIPAGTYSLSAVANGIASDPVDFTVGSGGPSPRFHGALGATSRVIVEDPRPAGVPFSTPEIVTSGGSNPAVNLQVPGGQEVRAPVVGNTFGSTTLPPPTLELVGPSDSRSLLEILSLWESEAADLVLPVAFPGSPPCQ